MKKILSLLFMIFVGLTLSSCLGGQKTSSTSYVSVEINPSVELVVDENGKVVTANGTNDDGKALIIDVKFEGKTIEQAIEIVLSEAEECGYLVSAKYNSDEVSKEVSISITTGSEEDRAALEADIKEKVNSFIEEHNLAAVYNELEAKKREYLESIVLAYNPALTEEEVKAMSYEDLIKNVELATIEKAQLASIALEEYYLSVKEYQFQMAYKEEIAGHLNRDQALLYNAARTFLQLAIDTIERIQYEVYVKEDSAYLQFLSQINSYKDKNVKLRVQLGSTENGAEFTAEIKANEEKIAEIEAKIVEFMNGINAKLEEAKASINEAIKSLETLEKTYTVDFNKVLTDVEQKINDTKDGLFASFEEEHSDDIAAAKAQVEARKQALTSAE